MCHILSVLFLTSYGRNYYSISLSTNAYIETLHAPTCPQFKQVSKPYTECFPHKHLFFLTTKLSTRKTLKSFRKYHDILGCLLIRNKSMHILYI